MASAATEHPSGPIAGASIGRVVVLSAPPAPSEASRPVVRAHSLPTVQRQQTPERSHGTILEPRASVDTEQNATQTVSSAQTTGQGHPGRHHCGTDRSTLLPIAPTINGP